MKNLVSSKFDTKSEIYVKEEPHDASEDKELKLEMTINGETFEASDANLCRENDIAYSTTQNDNQNFSEDVGTMLDFIQLPSSNSSLENIASTNKSNVGRRKGQEKILVSYNDRSIVLELNKIHSVSDLYDSTKRMLSIEEDFQLLRFDKDFEVDVLIVDIKEIADRERITVKKKISVPRQQLNLVKPLVTNNRSCASWSSNFELPDFGVVSIKLKEGLKIKRGDETDIVKGLFGAVKKYTIYPKSSEYSNITTALLKKFPQLKGNLEWNDAYELWKGKIICHFQNNRHRNLNELPIVQSRKIKNKRKIDIADANTSSSSLNKKVDIWGLKNYLPDRLQDETDKTIEDHISFLKTEKLNRRRQNMDKVASSMAATFAERRKDIVSERATVKSITSKYPWILDETQILLEYSRITGDEMSIEEVLRQGFNSMVKSLNRMVFSSRMKNEEVVSIIEKFTFLLAEEKDEYTMRYSSILVMHFLGEHVEDIIGVEDEETPVKILVRDGSSLADSSSFEVKFDGVKVTCSTYDKAVSVFVAIHFIFNLTHSLKNKKFLTYVEKFILKIKNNLPILKAVCNFHKNIKED